MNESVNIAEVKESPKWGTLQPRLFEFKAWHLPTRTMHLVDSFNCDFVYLPWNDTKPDSENYKVVDHPLNRADCILLQFTGVYDKNGVKIWEGDILYWHHFDESENELFESWHEVVFRNGAFGTLDGDEDLNTFYDLTIGDVVVGNVYEHMDLLAQCRPKHAQNQLE